MRDVEVLLGDMSSSRDKITLALKAEGFLTITGIFNWIQENELLIGISKPAIIKTLDLIIEEGLVRKESFDYIMGKKEDPRSVVIGSRPKDSP